ncbi:MAG TPA: GspE/PulE family protein [Patescibacteria group bacterium]|nr:GspE/PulE family protein [Patescibacteria group bacterium]
MTDAKHFLHSTTKDLADSLYQTNLQMEEQEAKRRATALGFQYIDLKNFPVDLNVLGLWTETEAAAAQGAIFYRDGNDLRVGCVDPKNPALIEKLKDLQNQYDLSIYICSKSSFDTTLKLYKKIVTAQHHHGETVDITKHLNYSEAVKKITTADPAQLGAGYILEAIFSAAMAATASDIHFEPEKNSLRVRIRIDGLLQDVFLLDRSKQKEIYSRIKILSKMKLNVENLPQDGRMTFYYLKKPIDVRVSSLPSAYGEAFVLRLLGTGTIRLSMDKLGLVGHSANVIFDELARPNGMIITTGPTGSGKTTTLYTFLAELNKPGVKIITLEDPIEYKLEGIQQTPIDHTVDFSFAKGLRAVLRQDPDIVMVGEIRDQETAETALQASLTGHIVLSTLHTNDAASSITRLYNMGVKPYVIAPALNAIIAQRLLRRICEHCKVESVLDPHLLEKIMLQLKAIPEKFRSFDIRKVTFYHSPGCEQCMNLGYKGRIGVYEIIQVEENIKNLILKEASINEIKKTARENGSLSMTQDGLVKALMGITDVEEVLRVTGEY